jgi:DNA-binding NarL/FixJ family response regulator
MFPRVIGIDGNSLCLLGLQQVCEEEGWEWCGGFQDVRECESLLESHSIDILVSELRIGRKDILDHWQDRCLFESRTKLVLHTLDGNPTHVARAAACRAWDYVVKHEPMDRLIQSLRSTAAPDRLPDSLIQSVMQYLRECPSFHGPEGASLTKRERQILAHLALGLSNREIAMSIAISLETVKEHVQNVLRKLKAKDRTAAAVWAIRNGWNPLTSEPRFPSADGRGESTKERRGGVGEAP